MNRNTLMLPLEVRGFTASPITVRIPVVAGGTGREARHAMNLAIGVAASALMKAQGYPGTALQEMNASFEIKTNQRGVFSLSLVNYAYAGGAHGMTFQKSLTFDADTGKRYRLAELFRPGTDYEKRLNDLIRTQIAVRQLPLITEYPGVSPEQDFYISDKALVVYFPLYALVPYTWGFPYFPISVYDLHELVDEEGPLGVMMY